MLTTVANLLGALLLFASPAPQDAEANILTRPGDGKPLRVEVGIYLFDLAAVDGADQSFRADVLVQVVWRDPRLAVASEDGPRILPLNDVWHPRIEVVNRRSIERSLGEDVLVDRDGKVSYSQRFLGTFSSHMDLREFPLDRQRFYVQVAVGHFGDDLEVLPPQGDDVVAGRSEVLSISDWRIGNVELESMPVEIARDAPVPAIALVMDARRELRYYVVQVILPLMMIVTMAWTVFWIDPSVVTTRIGTVVTTMLTLIAYRFALASLVPRLPYLTRLDWFLLGSTSLILATLMTMAASAHLKSRGREELVTRLNRQGRVAFVLAAILVWTLPWLL
jgi:hypothetical protein